MARTMLLPFSCWISCLICLTSACIWLMLLWSWFWSWFVLFCNCYIPCCISWSMLTSWEGWVVWEQLHLLTDRVQRMSQNRHFRSGHCSLCPIGGEAHPPNSCLRSNSTSSIEVQIPSPPSITTCWYTFADSERAAWTWQRLRWSQQRRGPAQLLNKQLATLPSSVHITGRAWHIQQVWHPKLYSY